MPSYNLRFDAGGYCDLILLWNLNVQNGASCCCSFKGRWQAYIFQNWLVWLFVQTPLGDRCHSIFVVLEDELFVTPLHTSDLEVHNMGEACWQVNDQANDLEAKIESTH